MRCYALFEEALALASSEHNPMLRMQLLDKRVHAAIMTGSAGEDLTRWIVEGERLSTAHANAYYKALSRLQRARWEIKQQRWQASILAPPDVLTVDFDLGDPGMELTTRSDELGTRAARPALDSVDSLQRGFGSLSKPSDLPASASAATTATLVIIAAWCF